MIKIASLVDDAKDEYLTPDKLSKIIESCPPKDLWTLTKNLIKNDSFMLVYGNLVNEFIDQYITLIFRQIKTKEDFSFLDEYFDAFARRIDFDDLYFNNFMVYLKMSKYIPQNNSFRKIIIDHYDNVLNDQSYGDSVKEQARKDKQFYVNAFV